MLEGGEDPRFIARRMVILASEDIGNADPQALVVAVAAAQAVEHVGLPEGQYALAQAAIYLSLAPKSNAASKAIGAAREHVREHGAKPPPAYLQSAAYSAAARWAAAAATTTRTTAPATSPGRSSRPRASRASASTRPTTRRPRCASAWRRSAGRAGGRVAVEATAAAAQLESFSPATGERARGGGGRAAARRWPPRSARRRACSRCGRSCAWATARATWPAPPRR